MRIITGSARGRKLLAPEGLHTRPTSELVKEAVFSIIQFEIEGSAVIDLFAGSGQMGIEALSRGAKSCHFVDQSKACRAVIEANLDGTGFADRARVFQMDASAYVRSAQGSADIAFIDPPYGKALLQKLLPELAGIMSRRGIIVCETDKSEDLPETAGGLPKHREYRYGKTKITVYRQKEDE